MPFFHGIRVNQLPADLKPVLEKSSAVIGLLATATAPVGAPTVALDAAFPVGVPVLITNVAAAIAAAGTGGTLKPALEAIRDQGSPLIIVIRSAITTGELADPTQSELLIDAMQGFLTAEAQTSIRPRIFGAPGLDEQTVVNALVTVAQSLRGMVYAHCRDVDGAICATRVDAALYADGFGQRELMLLWPDFAGWDGKAVAVALGLRAMIDTKRGWHKSLSNVTVNGVTGITKDVTFDIRSDTCDAHVLNQANVTTLIRMNGFRFWGNRTTSADPEYAFEVATRTDQAIEDAIADAEAPYIDEPMTLALVRTIEEVADMKLSVYKAQGRIIGGNAFYDWALNPVDQLQNGQLHLNYDFTAVAPMEGLGLNKRITGKYYLSFAQNLSD